jgi:hypothetical protein
MPLSETVSVPVGRITFSVPLLDPVAVGENLTEIEQCVPAAIVVEQEFDSE